MSADPLQALEILTVLAVEAVGENVVVLAIVDVALSVQEPRGDLVLRRVLDDGDDTLEFFGGKLTSAVKIRRQYRSVVFGYFESSSFFPSFLSPSLSPCFPNTQVGNKNRTYRLVKSTSAFLQTKFEYRRPTPLISVKATMIFCLPSTLVLSRRRMYWKLDFSPDTSAIRIEVAKSQPFEFQFKQMQSIHHQCSYRIYPASLLSDRLQKDGLI